MEWSGELHLIVCLDAYVGPTPIVDDSVRKQLLSESQTEQIQGAITDKMENSANTLGSYWGLLSCSGLDFEEKPQGLLAIIEQGILHRALFDLTTFGRVKSSQMRCYSHVCEFRALIEEFLVKNHDLGFLGRVDMEKLWWDSQEPIQKNPQPWVSPELQRDPNFMLVLESWLSDSGELQRWLNEFEATTPTVNNPKDPNRVFSHTVAMKTIEFAKVRYLTRHCATN